MDYNEFFLYIDAEMEKEHLGEVERWNSVEELEKVAKIFNFSPENYIDDTIQMVSERLQCNELRSHIRWLFEFVAPKYKDTINNSFVRHAKKNSK